jgi:hypothetical protein
MSMKARQDELFARWRAQRPGFVADGIVNEEKYLRAPRRIVFLLKEVNSPNEGNWDLVESQLKEGASKATWINMSLWTHGLINLEREIDWSFYDARDVEFRKECLRLACYVNIKKSPGASVADEQKVRAEAQEDAVFIREQISIYDPHLIVCAGTGDAYFNICDFDDKRWKRTQRGIYYFFTEEGTPVLSCPHPAARVKSSILYYSILDAAREVLGKSLEVVGHI